MLGGSLLAHRAQQTRKSGPVDITITIELQQMYAKDVNTTVERLTSVIAANLALDRGSFHINVKPEDKLEEQPSLCFLERDVA